MPELPEVETVRTGLEKAIIGKRITHVHVNQSSLRKPVPEKFSDLVTNGVVRNIGRRGKYLIVELDNGINILVHLGMTGRLFYMRHHDERPEGINFRHDHVVFQLSDEDFLIYNDPRRFGIVDAYSNNVIHPSISQMGPEPLDADFGGPTLMKAFTKRKTPIKIALLDQSLVAGIGNIYACEALWRAKISPLRAASSLTVSQARLLASSVQDVLIDAIEAGGSSLRDYRNADGEKGAFQDKFSVYDREGEGCQRCTGVVKRVTQGGRSTFYCPSCQV